MFPTSARFNTTSASSVANPASAPTVSAFDTAESDLFYTLFAMPAPINTIDQDFCLFDQDETSLFDYPLFNGANAAQAKTMKTAQASTNAAALNYFSNPLCTPQTPSMDFVAASTGLGFDSCQAFLEDSAMAQNNLIDTPFTPYLDTPALIDTPLETPFLTDFGLDADMDAKLNANTAFPLFPDFAFDFAYAAEPNMLLPLAKDISSAPVSPVKSVHSDFSEEMESWSEEEEEEDDDEFVSSRSAALVSGLKRKTSTGSDLTVKKTRTDAEMARGMKPAATKRFTCNYDGCDRRFARLFNLHTHEKTHDPVQARPFICPEADCLKAFSRKHDLQRHEASVHKGERNFACTSCHKPFSRQDGLRRHLAVKGPCSDNAWLAT